MSSRIWIPNFIKNFQIDTQIIFYRILTSYLLTNTRDIGVEQRDLEIDDVGISVDVPETQALLQRPIFSLTIGHATWRHWSR